MNLKAIVGVAKSKVARQVLVSKKHSPVILFAVGVAGVVGTVVLASRATLKLETVIEEAQTDLEKARGLEHPNYSENDRQKDITIVYARSALKIVRLYGPAVIVGTISVAALTGSHIILSRRNVALTAAYAVLDKGFREYRQRIVDEYGVDKDREIRYGLTDREVAEDTEEGVIVKTVRDATANVSIYARFFDESSSSWSKTHAYNQLFIQCQQNYANDLLRSRGHVFLNEVFDMLGISRTRAGAVVGWVKGEGDDMIDFGVFEGDRHSGMRFVMGHERNILLDFNVDGVIYDKI